jgi:hypothetical protein
VGWWGVCPGSQHKATENSLCLTQRPPQARRLRASGGGKPPFLLHTRVAPWRGESALLCHALCSRRIRVSESPSDLQGCPVTRRGRMRGALGWVSSQGQVFVQKLDRNSAVFLFLMKPIVCKHLHLGCSNLLQ